MKRKIEDLKVDIGCLSMDDRWGVLQENLTEEIEASELKKEKIWVKEGECDECGAYDVLSRVENRFICPECTKLLKNNNKNKSSKTSKIKAKRN